MKRASCLRHRLQRRGVWLVLVPLLLASASRSARSQSVKLSGSAPSSVTDFESSPNGRWVVYTDDTLSVHGAALLSVPMTRETLVRLNPLASPSTSIELFLVSPDSSRVVYMISERSDTNDRRLFSVPIGGPSTEAVELAGPPLGDEVVISPDSSRVFFRSTLGMDVDLFSVPIDGSEVAVPLHDGAVFPYEVPAGSGYAIGSEYFVTPDSSQVVYTMIVALPTGNFPVTPAVVPADGSSPAVALHEPIWLLASPTLLLTPDGARALLHPGPSGELLSIPLDDPASVKTISPPPGASNARDFAVSPDSRWVAFLADDDLGPGVGLYFARLDRSGTAHAALRSELVPAPVAHSLEIDPSSRRIVFTAQSSSTAPIELWSVLLDPRASPTKLNDPIVPAGGEVLDFQVSPDGAWVVYRADQLYEDWPMGFRVPIGGPTGSAEPIWGLAPLDPRDWRITPDGRSVVLASVAPFVDSVYRPWSVPLVGTPRPGGRELVDDAAFQPDGDLAELWVGAGGRVVYLADQDTEGVLELYLVTLLFADGFESGDTSAWSATLP